jgi:hypothetical protein
MERPWDAAGHANPPMATEQNAAMSSRAQGAINGLARADQPLRIACHRIRCTR